MVVDLVTGYGAYVLGLALALPIALATGEANALVALVAIVFGLFAFGLSVVALVLSGRRQDALGPRVGHLNAVRAAIAFVEQADSRLARNPRILVVATAWQAGIILLDAASVWVLVRAVGVSASPSGVFASFMISSLLRTIGLMPGGLGTYEAASVITLRMVGVPVAAGLSATLLFRGLSFWLPMIPGLWLSHRELARTKTYATRTSTELDPRQPLDALLAELRSSLEGLSSDEAERRLRTYGPNEPTPHHLRGRARATLRAASNPLVLILLVACLASAVLGEGTNAAIIGGIVVLSAAIDAWQAARSDRAVRRLQERIAPTATVRRDGAFVELPRSDLVVGDVVRLSAGDLVPADARLCEARDLHVQQAALTGESFPSEKSASDGPLDQGGTESPGLVYLGTSVVSGMATALVFATGADTAFRDIAARLSERPAETEFERGARRFGTLILQTVLALVAFLLVVNVALGRNALDSLLFSLALAVGLTPEFLPMISTVTLARGAVQMARAQVIVKHLSAIQNLGSIDVLCSDKTGTLTAGTVSFDEALDPVGQPSERPLWLGRLNARFESGIRSPIDAALLEKAPPPPGGCSKTDEIPFDFERRRLSVIVRLTEGTGTFLMVTKGAPEGVLAVCSHYEREGATRELDEAARSRCVEVFRDKSATGARVLAVAYRAVEQPQGYAARDERGLTLAGFLAFADHLLPGAAASLERLRRDGVEVKILSGDNELVTRHTCEQVGLHEGHIVLGAEVDELDDAELGRLAEEARIFARVTPGQKHRILGALRARGHVVGFLGDGINDAPSLHAADVGISVAGAVDVAREASDILLLEPRIDVLHAGILAGRRASGNVLKYLLMGTSSNFGNMFSMAGAALFLPFLPMLPMQILLNNFLYDFAQITIPTDHVDRAYTERPQRWDIGILRRFMLMIGPVSSVYDFVTFWALLRVFHFDETRFHTGWFVESLATQTLVLFVIRTAGRPWKNRPSWPLAVTTVLVVVVGAFLPGARVASALGFAPLPASYFLYLAGVVLTYLVLVEWVKGRAMGQLFAPGTSGAAAPTSSPPPVPSTGQV